jgi:hypothetical protein
MVKRCQRFGLALKSGDALGIARQFLRQNFDRNIAFERA